MEFPALKSLIGPNQEVNFVKYFDNQLWYKVEYVNEGSCRGQTFEFPVPISDIGTATFLAKDKSILFMRYIRKHIELLKAAQKEAP